MVFECEVISTSRSELRLMMTPGVTEVVGDEALHIFDFSRMARILYVYIPIHYLRGEFSLKNPEFL